MRERHVELESARLRLGLQLGQARCDKYQGSPDLFPTFVLGWNWRIFTGCTLGWLFWYVNFYVITPAYAKDIRKRREWHFNEKWGISNEPRDVQRRESTFICL